LFRQVINDHPNTRGAKAARLRDKAKEKLAKKTGAQTGARQKVKAREKGAKKASSRDDESTSPEENPDYTREEGNAEALPCAFTITYI
jgi:hypothetical protein